MKLESSTFQHAVAGLRLQESSLVSMATDLPSLHNRLDDACAVRSQSDQQVSAGQHWCCARGVNHGRPTVRDKRWHRTTDVVVARKLVARNSRTAQSYASQTKCVRL